MIFIFSNYVQELNSISPESILQIIVAIALISF